MPDDLAPDELTMARAEELLAAPPTTACWAPIPRRGSTSRSRPGRFGPYVQLGEAGDGRRQAADRVAVLHHGPGHRSPSSRRSSCCASRGGRDRPRDRRGDRGPQRKFGPYLKRGTDTRSLASEEQILTVTLDEAQALFAQPKQRRGRTPRRPLRELGPTRPPSCPSWSRRAASGPT